MLVFFCKQKTAYEMRISDWSSDVCSSDLAPLGKELYDRLAKVGEDLRKVGAGLNSAVTNFNAFTNSFNSRLVSTGRKFKELNIETGSRELDDVGAVEALANVSGGSHAALTDRRGDDPAEAAE